MREFYLSRDLRSFRHTILRGFFVSLFLLFAVTTKLAAKERAIVKTESGQETISSTERLLVNAIGSSESTIFSENALRVEDDLTPPTVLTKNISLALDETSSVTLTPQMIDDGSSDNVGITEMTLDITSFDCSQLGEHTVTLTVWDAAGNSASAPAVVTVFDNIPPGLSTNNFTVILDANGKAAFRPEDFSYKMELTAYTDYTYNLISFRNGGISAGGAIPEDLDGLYFTLDGSSYHQLFWKESNTSYSYYYIDTDGPDYSLNAEVLFGEDPGTLTLSFAPWYDNCGDVQVELSQQEFTCADVGNNEIVLTARDVNGNEVTAAITVTDTIRPVLSVQNFTVNFESDAAEVITIIPEDLVVEATDNCGIQETVLSRNSFSPTDAGANEVTVSLTDTYGNRVEQKVIVTVTAPDDTPPIALAQDITVELEQSGTVNISPEQIDNGSTDNLRITELSLDQSSFDCSQLGDHMVTLTAWDAAGNSASATAVLTVIDNLPPALVNSNLTLVLDADGKATFTPEDYSFEVSLTVSPFYSSNQVVIGGFKVGGLTPEDLDGLSFTLDGYTFHRLFLAYNYNSNSYVYNIDKDGYSSTPNARDIFGNTSGEFSLKFALWYDNCGEVQSDLVARTFSCEDLGDNPLPLTLTDSHGNRMEETLTITVTDTIRPVLSVQNFTVNFESDAAEAITITSADLVVEATDNCGIQEPVLSRTTFSPKDAGENEVTVTLTDTHGNTVEQRTIVTVTAPDDTPPVVLTQDLTLELDRSGKASISPEQIDIGSTDNLRITELSLDQSSFDCSQMGNNTVTLTAWDAAGNSNSATAVVTVVDNTPPALPSKNLTLMLDADGKAVLRAEDFSFEMTLRMYLYTNNLIEVYDFSADGLSPEDLDGLYFTRDGSTFHQLFFIRTDYSTSYYYIDTDRYHSTPNAEDIFGEAYGEFSLNLTPFYDNCGIQLTASKEVFNCEEVGDHEVTLTATDGSGNESIQQTIITVMDTISPKLTVQPMEATLDADGNATIRAKDLVVEATDNCGIQDTLLSQTVFSQADAGEQEVVLTLVDVNGNSVEQTAVVSIPDITPPTILFPVNSKVASDADQCGALVNYLEEVVDVSVPDYNAGLGGNEQWQSFKAGETGRLTKLQLHLNGPVTPMFKLVIFEGTGVTGRKMYSVDYQKEAQNSGWLDVSIPYTDAPMLEEGKNYTFQIQGGIELVGTYPGEYAEGKYYSSHFWGSSDADLAFKVSVTTGIVALDNSGEVAITQIAGLPSGSVFSLGTTTNTFEFTDWGGNTVQSSFTITVEDQTPPTLVTENISLELDANGAATIKPEDVIIEATDNCGIADHVISQTAFDCTDLGNNEVFVTVTDQSGNESKATVMVRVLDVTNPAIAQKEAITVIAEPGACSAVVNFELPVVNDVCGASLEQIAGLASGSEFPLGTTELVFRATDNSGNTTTSSFQVTVEPVNQAPGLDALEGLIVPAHQTSVELVLTGIHAGADCQGQRVESIVIDAADQSMVTAMQVDYTPGEETARVSLALAEGQSGETTISIRLKDNGGTANGGLDETQASFTLSVQENQSPEVIGENLTIYVDKNSTVTEDLSANLFSDADEGDRLLYQMSLEDDTALPAWANFNAESVELAVTPTETELGEHRFKLTATDLSGASASIEVLVVVQIPTGLDEFTKNMSLKVYPNPSRGMVQVAIQAENSLEVELSVCNLLGQEIHRKSYFLSEPIQLNLSNQMDGVYLIQVKLGTSILTKKVILRK